MAEIGDIPEAVFAVAAFAVDPIDPGATQRNMSFRQAVAAGWIQGRASIPDDEEPTYAHDAHCNTFHEPGPEGCPPAVQRPPDHDAVYLDIRDGQVTMTQTTGRTLDVMVNGEHIAVPDRVRATINWGQGVAIEYGLEE